MTPEVERERKRLRSKRLRLDRQAAGLCIRCEEPAAAGLDGELRTLCEVCQLVARGKAFSRQRARARALRGEIRVHRCRACGGVGHNSATCAGSRAFRMVACLSG